MANETDVTTVRLSEKAQQIKEELAPVFGLKNILSAGLVLFNKLNAERQKDIIKEANSIEPESVVDDVISRAKSASRRVGKARPAS